VGNICFGLIHAICDDGKIFVWAFSCLFLVLIILFSFTTETSRFFSVNMFDALLQLLL